jgi:hypothetical protein
MVHTIGARRPILARKFEAFINIVFAVKPFPARSAFAGVAVDRRRLVNAGRPVQTGIVVDTLIDVDLAEWASPTERADTSVAVPKLPLVLSFFANAIIDAGVGVAVLLLVHDDVELGEIFGLIFRRYHDKLLGNGVVGPFGTRVLVDDMLRFVEYN